MPGRRQHQNQKSNKTEKEENIASAKINNIYATTATAATHDVEVLAINANVIGIPR